MQVSPNIELIEEGFGSFNHAIIPFLLKTVEDFFRQQGVIPTKRLVVVRGENEPMCCPTSDSNIHVIKLNTEGDRWCQWVYQFAHEYCHHIIDGGLTGETSGLKWLEESICHVASYVCLDFFERRCASSTISYLPGYAPCVISYLKNLLLDEGQQLYERYLPDLNNPLRKVQIPQEEMKPIYPYVESRADVLATTYSMGDYMAIAKKLFPHFYNNPALWRILPHLGDTRKWNSPQELFDYLQVKADDEYRESLEGLKGCLIAEQG